MVGVVLIAVDMGKVANCVCTNCGNLSGTLSFHDSPASDELAFPELPSVITPSLGVQNGAGVNGPIPGWRPTRAAGFIPF